MGEEASLEHTPTWVVATVCLVIVSVSLAAERFLHYLGKYLKHKEQKALFSALQRLKEELMLLGFISFVLSLSQGFTVNICIPENATDFMLPCKRENRRVAEEGSRICKKKGDVPLLSVEALHQLHIFIFVLGLVHVVFCATTILLGGAKMRKWKHWETEIHREIGEKLHQAQIERKSTPLSAVLHRNHQGEFVRERTKGFWMKLAVVSWIFKSGEMNTSETALLPAKIHLALRTAFLKQFHDSVSKSDYEALRSAFVLIHYPRKPDFDFHKYMIRALEHEFKRVVGISWYLWLFVIIFLLLNINGWHTYFWLAFLPLFLLLIVGAKLEHIITRLAQEAAASLSNETEEVPKIKPSKEHFWFHKPGLVLHLIHFILFQNSFEIGFFFWVLMGGEIKLHGFGSDVHESVHGWLTEAQRRNTFLKKAAAGGDPDLDSGGEVKVTRAVAAPDERTAGTSRGMLMTAHPPPPDLDEIVTVDGG
ncbi:MLO-like protein 13 [Panicum miliaceum]|uniref:MLO-like protein n=1 Tax=Panicum miliaceum TaxID=4540 RepID=A0A3L6S056_PANMI|nr:MLO-like protein 13 [Panicum miliaceum]